MAGIENTIIFGRGFKLQPSLSDDITRMQNTDTTSFVNFNATPEGSVSANIGSIAVDRVGGNLYIKKTGTGNTGWLSVGNISINGDSGSITGSTVTIYANNAVNNSGASVSFVNSGTTSTLNVTDASGNTSIGENAGNIANLGGRNVVLGKLAGQNLAGTGVGALGAENVLLGYNTGNAMTTGFQNIAIGPYTLDSLTTGSVNTCLGYSAGSNLLTGQYSVLLGVNAGSNYNSNESGNIVLGSVAGTTAESNTIRIGAQGSGIAQQNRCFIAGIKSIVTSNSETVTIDTTTGQLGSTPNITPSNIKITTYNVVDSPATWTKDARTKVIEVFGWAGGGGAGSGRKGTTALSSGGSGAPSGGGFWYKGIESYFGSTETVIIGAGGVGGASQTTNATNGNPGLPGDPSSFGNIVGGGGQGSIGGTTGNGTGVAGTAFVTQSTQVQAPASGAGNAAAGSNSNPPTQVNPNVGSGGGGGGGANTITERVGGNGGSRTTISATILVGGLGGLESTGINGGNGNPPLSTGGLMVGGTGGGGGGGYTNGSSGNTTGGTGGNGAIPGGGGGGGGGGIDSVANSGAGGNGGDGLVIVIEYF